MTRPLTAWLADYRRAQRRRDRAIQRAIEESRPAYARACAPTKPTGRPKKAQQQGWTEKSALRA